MSPEPVQHIFKALLGWFVEKFSWPAKILEDDDCSKLELLNPLRIVRIGCNAVLSQA
jgi:hypothetical protein